MPLYEYACQKCGKHFEKLEKFGGPHLKKCPSCGGRVERLISPPAIQFKGSGWYVTDYAKSSSGGAKESGEQGASQTAKSDSKSESTAQASTSAKETSKEKKKTPAKSK